MAPRRGKRALLAPFAMAALAGCGSGCDGERVKPPEPPRQPPIALADAGTAGAGTNGSGASVPLDGGVAVASGYLDAPSGALNHFFRGLAAAERAKDPGNGGPGIRANDPSARVLVAVFGDSHTAGDSMTSRIRVSLQAQFGDAGRGLVAAGRPPARHYYQRDVRYGATGAWKAAVGGSRDPEPFGIAGLRVYGDRKGAQLWVETCPDCPAGTSVSQFEILYQSAPGRGTIKYRVDDAAWQQLAMKSATIQPPHPARQVIAVPDGAHRLTLEHVGGGVVDLYGVVLERQRPGVIVDSLGVVGRRLGSLRSWDWSIIGDQLATRDPRLVVIQYGTNEADDPDLDLEAMAKYYDDTILRIRAAAPTAGILILGAPDMAVREAGKACDRMRPPRPVPGAAGPPAVPAECQWRTPGVIREIVAIQNAAAIRNKVAFFNTLAAMGGSDKMDTWFMAEPKFAYKDRVHFTDLGYHLWADEITKALLAEFDRWKGGASAHRVTPPVSSLPPVPASHVAPR